MGLGPAACDKCYILYEHKPTFQCPRCHDNDTTMFMMLEGFLVNEIVNSRTRFFKSIPKHVRLFKIHDEWPHTLFRPFMLKDRDPNEIYRDWLENNVGKQGLHWDWDLTSDLDLLQINFREAEHAVLFELTWPSQ